jgi:hypothetical protein
VGQDGGVGWVILFGYVLLAGVWIVVVWVIRGLVSRLGWTRSRALPTPVVAGLAAIPERRPGQHLVDLELRDGRVVRRIRVDRGLYPSRA